VTGAERILLFGALGMLLVSAGLADGARVDVAAGGGSALDAHVHAGSLGWITLAVLAVALRMAEGDDRPVRSSRLARGLSGFTTATIAAFVVADVAGSVDGEVWTGAVALAAIVVFLARLAVVSRRERVAWTVPRLSMAAALAVLVVGSVIGAISAGNAATGHLAVAASLASSHSAILVVPFVVLASTSVLEWSALPSSSSLALTTAGLVQVGALALSAAAVTAGVVWHDLALVEANIPLVFGGIAIFLVRVGPVVLAAGWARSSRIWLVTGTVGVAVDVGLFAHVVFEIGARRYVSVDTVPQWLVFSVDHVTFVAVGTTALFGAVAAMAGQGDRWLETDVPAAAGLVLGLAGTAAGIGLGSLAVEQVGVTVLGVSVFAATAVAGLRVAGVTRVRRF
jgi:hypothetical protein